MSAQLAASIASAGYLARAVEVLGPDAWVRDVLAVASALARAEPWAEREGLAFASQTELGCVLSGGRSLRLHGGAVLQRPEHVGPHAL